MKWLATKEHKIDLAQSFSGRRRVFFVGKYWWDQINRPTSRRFRGQEVKQHGLWYFVKLANVEPYLVVEVPVVSWWMNKRWNKVNQLEHVPTGQVEYNRREIEVSKEPRLTKNCKDK